MNLIKILQIQKTLKKVDLLLIIEENQHLEEQQNATKEGKPVLTKNTTDHYFENKG